MSAWVLAVEGAVVRAGERHDGGFLLTVPELRLAPGDRIAVCGPSGCGKSMLIEFLALLVRPERIGRFMLSDVGDLAPPLSEGRLDSLAGLRAGVIGYAPQSGGVLPFLKARAHASAVMRLRGTQADEQIRARFEALADSIGIRQHLDKTREQLSGGQRKRVSLLAAMATPRRLLLVDEPTTGLDDQAGAADMYTLSRLATADGTAVLISTHDPEAAARAGFEIVPLEHGVFRLASPGVAA